MRDYLVIIVALLAVYGLWLTVEAVRAKRDRDKLRHVIYVNGTRGKSTVTRMICAGLQGMGLRVLCKTTGTVPLCIYPDGREESVLRRAPANIREQLRYLHLAAREGAEVLVIECMALDPQLQRVSSRRMLRADIGVITNARLDHTDVMGDSREAILDCLMEMLPVNGQVFTAEADLFSQVTARCAKLGSAVTLADPSEAGAVKEGEFADNVALALSVCRSVTGGEDRVLLDAIGTYRPDPYALSVYRNGALRLVNAMSANDPDSTKLILQRVRGGAEERLVLLINNRADRPHRARDMAGLCGELCPEEVWLLGEGKGALSRLCRRLAPQTVVRSFDRAAELPLDGADRPTLILAVGNIKGEGIALVERGRREMLPVDPDGQ